MNPRGAAVLFGSFVLLAPAIAAAQDAPPAAPSAPPAAPAPADPAASSSRAQQLRRLSEQVHAQESQLEEQKAAIKRLETQMEETKKAMPAPPPPEPILKVAPITGKEGREVLDDPREHILIYGYAQAQFQTDNASQDEVSADGRSLNQNRFVVPRARLIAEREWRLASALLEFDGNTLNGPGVGLQRAEASVLYRGSNAPPLPPMLSVTLGQFRVPFGDENLQSPGVRYFMERSLTSRAFFPSEIDLGLRIAGAIGWFRYQLAATNGEPIGTKDFPLQDPDSAKDVGGRLGVVVEPAKMLGVTAGFSTLVGRGFHKESAGTKSTVRWNDDNGDGIFQPNEVSAVPAVGAKPSSTYRRFAVGLDGEATLHWNVSSWPMQTQLGGAFYVGNNMDRGVFYSDPILLGRDTRHTGYMVQLLQEVGDWVVVGVRADYYNPDSDAVDFQNTKPVQPTDRAIHTYSPLLGLRLEKRARLLFEYDFVRDKFARDAAGIPTDLSNDRMTARLQVNL